MEATTSTINERWKLCTFTSFIGFIILIFFLNRAHDNSVTFVTLQNRDEPNNVLVLQQLSFMSNVTHKEIMKEEEEKCNIFDGKWVYDPNASPMYNASQCPFLSDKVSCHRNGRPDSEYEKWSWEGKGSCNIPRFNATDMLERLRGKRVIIVGDSLNRNQFESLACILYSAIPSSRAYVEVTSSEYKIFRAKDYNCSVEFYWSPFLVQLEVNNKANGSRVLRLDKLSASAQKWRGADIMIINSGYWWMHIGKLKAWDVFEYRGKPVENMKVESAYKKAIRTWGRWIDGNVDTNKTTVFVRSISRGHEGGQCHNQSQPIFDESQVAAFPSPLLDIVGTIQGMRRRGMKTPVRFLNITKMCGFRIDAHPSVYREKPGMNGDCSHWCLPGVPDTWNRLVYASMVLDAPGKMRS